MSQPASAAPSRKKTVISLLVLAALTGIIVLLFKDNWAEITAALSQLSAWQVLVVLAIGLSYPLLEGCVAWVIVRSRIPGFRLWQGIDTAWCGTFGNVVTLGAGAVPVQTWYLHRCGLPVGPGVGLMTLQYVFHKTTVLLYATVMLLFQHRWLAANTTGVMNYLPMAYAVVAAIIVVLVLVCVSPLVQNLARWLMRLLPKTEKWQQRRADWQQQLDVLGEESRRLLADKPRCAEILALQAVKLFGLFCLPYLCIRFMGLSPLSFLQVQLLTSLMLFLSNALPNVAGMGSIETAFLLVFGSFLERGEVMSVMMLYRIASYYVVFAASAVGFFFAQRHLTDLEPPKEDCPAMKDKRILSRFGIVILVLLALVLIFPSAKIDLASSIEASTQASVRVEHIQNFARSAETDGQLLSADDPAYQQIANVLSGLTCVKRFNQQYSSYSHEYPVDSVTVSYYDDAENNNLLFTVYSDGTAIVNSQFVKVKAPKGGAEEVYQKLAEIVK